jgi:phage terminase large subunit-like protein
MRKGDDPRVFVTTTPRPIPVLREIIADPSTVITRGKTMDNAANLAPSFMKAVIGRYAGTRLGRQELDAEMLDDVPGALWTRTMLDATRINAQPDCRRIVVAVDPSGTGGVDGGDDVGIVIAGLGIDGRGYVLGDWSCNLSPDGWGRRVGEAYAHYKADRIVAERNFGGAMVEAVIKAVDKKLPVTLVTASRGKVARAEPIAALYEQGRVSHVGSFAQLEDQLCSMTPSGYMGDNSPDRADALVWALSELMLGGSSYDIRALG